MDNQIVKFEDNGQLVQFGANEVKERLCPNIEDKELALVMALCQKQHLNPFTKDVYIVKYGSNPASIITSKETFTRRAADNPRFKGMKAGVTVLNNGQLMRRDGSLVLPQDQLVGGWCSVKVDGYDDPIFDEVALAEYTTGKANWIKMPGTMIRKVAMCHALREAFPSDFQGLYGEEEIAQSQAPAREITARVESVQNVQSHVQNDSLHVQSATPSAPTPVDTLRALMKQAKELGIVVNDKAVPEAGLMGWIRCKFGREVPELTPDEVSECITYVQNVIAGKQALEAQAQAQEAEYEVMEEF
jgi:phage recombination protein Bet